ncbi:MAG: aminotransferase class V-fold PLP-dependent enzyme [Bryobacteraceae bacterium]
MPRRASAALAEYAAVWESRGIRAWEEGWWDMPRTAGDLVGRIIGAGPGETVMLPNVSIAQSIVGSCFDWRGRRNKIVTDSENFHTNLYLHHALERQGARVVVVAPEEWEGAIDEETRLVSTCHVTFRHSRIQDLAPIIGRAHAAGAMVIADLYQSAGTVPVDVRALGVDFATGGSVKWLCGGPGAGYLYVRRDLWPRLEPSCTGWMAHRDPFAFETGPIEYASGAYRFLNGTPCVPALYAARPGCEIVLEIGVERIRAKSVRQTTRLIELALEAGLRVNCPMDAAERGGVVVLDVPNGGAVTAALLARDVLVDYRPGAGIRVAPHFYTTDDEVERTVREIAGSI